MNKHDKKVEKALIKALTQCCEEFKFEIDGFEWLTHTVNFSNINQSINVICVFNNNESLNKSCENNKQLMMSRSIENALKQLNITLQKPKKQIRFDSEENCALSHKGNWQLRLNQQYS